MTARLLAAAALALACACAATPPPPSGPGVPADVLTQQEIRRVETRRAYELVQRLRPEWLRPGDEFSLTRTEGRQVHVYVDGVFRGNARVLMDIPSSQVERMVYLDGDAARVQFGAENARAVIAISTWLRSSL